MHTDQEDWFMELQKEVKRDPLEIAVGMEIEGKEFYLKAGEKSGDQFGQKLFARLAREEDFHAVKALEIANALKSGQTPATIENLFDAGKRINSIFAWAQKDIEPRKQIAQDEFDAIRLALDLEERTRTFYKEQSTKAETEFERSFFKALMNEERGHYLSLVDYREYLTDPASWFVKAEHHSLDGA